MCGINGIVSFTRKGSFGATVTAMNEALKHRGPDDGGVFSEEGIALGHRRLSIIDLSPAGHQPMFYGNGRYVIVYNGELYNYRQLRSQLQEMTFATSSDTEVILAAYARWGTDCLSHFNGMFAFAIWDQQEKTTFIARDRLGIKPLYYAATNDGLAFSSELRPLLASGLCRRKLNASGLDDYLHYQTVHAEATIAEDAKMLLPGHFILLDAASASDKSPGPQEFSSRIHEWWKLRARPDAPSSYEKACGQVLQLLRDAVERRLVADVPFGAFLSGGIDSSAIVALMTEVSTVKVKTFSVVFDQSEFSEAVYARMIAKKFGTEHHEILLQPDDFLHALPAALDAMDHPTGDGPNTYVVSQATKKAGITMALSGLGGDELFAGYDIFRRAAWLESKRWIWSMPAFARRFSGSMLKTLRPGISSEKIASLLALPDVAPAKAVMMARTVLTGEQVAQITNGWSSQSILPGDKVISRQKRLELPKNDFLLSAVSIAEIETYMQNVLLRDTDQMSMAHALEVRVPFLDYQLVEYVLNLPDRYKFPHTPKKLLVDALGSRLPREIVDRPKMGFTFPWKSWMKNELRGFCEERLKQLGKRKPFSENGLMQLWSSFLKDDPRVSWSRIWPLVVLAHWLDKNGIDE